MRTPIQEVYAQLRASKESDSFGVAYGVDWLLENEKLILEKEKEVMCEFAFRFNHDAFTENYIKAEFEETFNNK